MKGTALSLCQPRAGAGHTQQGIIVFANVALNQETKALLHIGRLPAPAPAKLVREQLHVSAGNSDRLRKAGLGDLWMSVVVLMVHGNVASPTFPSYHYLTWTHFSRSATHPLRSTLTQQNCRGFSAGVLAPMEETGTVPSSPGAQTTGEGARKIVQAEPRGFMGNVIR